MRKMRKNRRVAAILPILALPIVTVVACGGGTVGGDGTGGSLTIGIRAEDQEYWSKVGDAFGKATEAKIDFKFIGNIESDYPLWAQSNTIPDLSVVGGGVTRTGYTEGWFQTMDLPDIMTNEKYMDYNSELPEEWQMTKIDSINDTDFNVDMLNSNILDETDPTQYVAAPYIYGPNAMYMWTKYANKSTIWNDDVNLEWYVPDGLGAVNKVADFDAPSATAVTSPLVKADGTRYKLTQEDVQEFLMNALRKSQQGFNFGGNSLDDLDFSGTGALYGSDTKDGVIATGTPGYYQRIYSVQKAIFDNKPDGDPMLDAGAQSGLGGFDSAALAQGKSSWDDSAVPNASTVNGIVNDDAWFSNVYDAGGSSRKEWSLADETNLPDEIKIQYLANSMYKIDDDAIRNQVGDGAFQKHMILNTEQPKWRLSAFEAWRNNGGYGDDGLTALSIPFSSVGVDSYALNRKTTGDKAELAKKLVRFIYQPKVSGLLSAGNAVPIRRNYLSDTPETFVDEAFKNSGVVNPATDKIDMPTQYISISTKSQMADYYQYSLNTTYDSSVRGFVSFEKYLGRINRLGREYEQNRQS